MQDRGGRSDARQRAREVWVAGQAHLREMEAKWRQEQEGLRLRIREGKDELEKATRRHKNERRVAREDLKKEVVAARTPQ